MNKADKLIERLVEELKEASPLSSAYMEGAFYVKQLHYTREQKTAARILDLIEEVEGYNQTLVDAIRKEFNL